MACRRKKIRDVQIGYSHINRVTCTDRYIFDTGSAGCIAGSECYVSP